MEPRIMTLVSSRGQGTKRVKEGSSSLLKKRTKITLLSGQVRIDEPAQNT